MWDWPKGTQKGIISLESDPETIYYATYGTFRQFIEIAVLGAELTITVKGLEKYKGKRLKFNVTARDKNGNPVKEPTQNGPFNIRGIGQGANDDWTGVNHWLTARGKNGGPDVSFFYFSKDEGGNVIPTKKLSQYFYKYEPFLKKKR